MVRVTPFFATVTTFLTTASRLRVVAVKVCITEVIEPPVFVAKRSELSETSSITNKKGNRRSLRLRLRRRSGWNLFGWERGSVEEWVNDGGTGAVAEYGQGQGLMGEWGIRRVAGYVYHWGRGGCEE